MGLQAAADGRRRFQRLIACDDAPAGGEVRLVEGEGKNDVAAGTKRGIRWKWVEKRAAAGGRGRLRLRKRRRYCVFYSWMMKNVAAAIYSSGSVDRIYEYVSSIPQEVRTGDALDKLWPARAMLR